LYLKELHMCPNELCMLRGLDTTAPHTLHILAAMAMLALGLAILVVDGMRKMSMIVSMMMMMMTSMVRDATVAEKRRKVKIASCLRSRKKSGRFGDRVADIMVWMMVIHVSVKDFTRFLFGSVNNDCTTI
jgi:hypothetical protein